MLPHESLRRSAAAGNPNPSAVDPQRAVSPNRTDKRTASPASVPRGRLNSPTAHHAAHPTTDGADPNSADDCVSSLVRPHSRQVASSSMKQSHHHASTVRATSPNTKQVRNPAGGSSSQPLHSDALHQSSPAHTVRTIGRAIVNPKTLFATSAVTTSSAVIPRHPATDSQHQPQQHSPLRLRVDSPDRQQGFHFTQPSQSSSSHPAPPHSYSTALPPTSPSRPGTTTLTSTLQLTDISLLTSPMKQGRGPTLGYSLVAAMPPHSSSVAGPRPASTASGLSSYHEVGVFGMTALRQHYGTTVNDVLVRGGGGGSSLAVAAAGAEMTTVPTEVVATTGPSSSSTDGLAPLPHDVDRVRAANKRGAAALGGCDSTPWENELQGVDVRRLVPPCLPAVDLKKVDMLEKLAPATAFDIIPPSITLQGEPNVVFDLSDAQLLHQSSSLPTTHGADEEDSHALAVRVPEFVVQTVTVRDAGIDRVLVYEVTVEVPGLFSSRFPPTIDSVTGDLIVFLDTKTSGTSRCHVCAVDVAMVDLTTGEPTKSNVLSFSITTLRSKGGGQSANNTTTKKIGAAHSTTTKTKHIYASPTDFSATLPADQLLRLAQRATATEAANASAVDPQTGVPIVPYEFPPTNPHELRYWDVIHANQTWLYQQQQQSSASSSSSSSKQQQLHEKSNYGSSNSTNGASKVETYQPVYDSSLSTLELLRFGRSTQERDRLAGEAVSLDDRETLVKRLRDRIAKEEADLNEHSGRAGSSSSSGGELELCPLLLRLSQVYMSYGVKKQGDTTELLERICRIRLRSIGLESFEALQQLSRSRSGGSSQHHHHQQRGGSESSAAGSPLFRDDDLRPSSSAAAARTAAVASLVSQASSNGGSGAITPVLGAVTPTSQNNNSAAIVAVTVAAAAFDEKKMEALQQSLMVLMVYLRSVGRFHDAIEYSGYCLDAALVSSGDSSAAYLRALSELAELWLQVGEYARARTLFEECVAKSEVLFGVEAHSTNNLVHALGIAWGEESEYGKAIKCHDRVLKIRQKAFGEGREAPNSNNNNNNNNATNAADQLLLAESMTLAAFYRSLSGSSSPATRERVTDLVESALTILTKSTASSEKVAPPSHFIASRSGLTVLLGRLIVSAGDIPRAITYMGRAYADLTTARGHDSLEAALVRVSLLAAKLMQYPRCLIDDTTNTIVGELVQATAVLTAQLGPQHPATLRASSLLAESRLFRNPTESSSQLEKNLSSMKNIFVSTHRSLLAAHRVTAESQLVLRRGSAALNNALAAHKIGSLLHMADQSMIALDTLLLGAMTRTRTPPSDELLEILERRLAFMVDLHGETNPLHVPCLQNLAEACFLRSDFTRSHYYLSRALKIADSVNFIFLLGGLFKPAAQLSMQEWQERNRMARDRIHTGQALQFAELLFTVGTVFAAEGKSDDAQSTFLQSFAALELSAVANSLGMVLVQHALSTLLYAGGHVGDALAYAERAYSLLLEHFSTRESLMEMLTDTTRAISFQLRCSGYQLLRHTDSRHRFASYL